MNGDRSFACVTKCCGFILVALVAFTGAMLFVKGFPALRTFGIHFVSSTVWDPVAGEFGVLPFMYGTVVSSLLALFLTEFSPFFLRTPLAYATELLAAIPSVIYGLWGVFYLVPWLRESVQQFFIYYLGFLPFFQGPPFGIGMFAAGVIFSLMLISIISSLSRDVLNAVPDHQREAALALGATQWEMIRVAVLRYGRSGIVGAIFLGLGRALGETIAVTMLIGNQPLISASLFAPAATMASVIANEFTEATDDLYLAALFGIGFVLFVLTFLINAGARHLVTSIGQGKMRKDE